MTGADFTRPESVLLFLQGRDPGDHPGIVDGYRSLIAQGIVRHLDIMPVFGANGVERGKAFWDEALECVSGNRITTVVFQCYHSPHLPDPRSTMIAMKKLSHPPFIVSTLGDAFPKRLLGKPSVPSSFLSVAEQSDLVLLTSMGALANYVAKFTKSPIMLCPHGACQVRFSRASSRLGPTEPDFDVTFIGSRNGGRNPFNPHYHFARRRIQLVNALSERFGRRFGLFGKGWDGVPSSQGPVPFEKQVEVARRGKVIVGGVPRSLERYYESDRPFIQMTSGVPIVESAVQGVASILRRDSHWVLAEEKALVKAVERVLEMDDSQRTEIGEAAAANVEINHTEAHRVETIIENVRRLRNAQDGEATPKPYLPFFLPEVNMELESPLATRNWPDIAS